MPPSSESWTLFPFRDFAPHNWLHRPFLSADAMHLARVIGTVVCSHKNARLQGVSLLLVQPVGSDGTDTGRALVATDSAGAGIGERVFFVRGSEAAYPFAPTVVPTDATVIGIVDHWDTASVPHVPVSTPEPAASRAVHASAAKRGSDGRASRRR